MRKRSVRRRIGDAMIWAAGADLDVLERCPTERARYVTLGGVVLAPALMATGSLTFALVNVFHAPLQFAVAVGLVWGLIIFNLDRWLVASVSRHGGFWATFAMYVPRVLLAVVLGAVIAEPLVLEAFRGNIEAELPVMEASAAAAHSRRLDADPRFEDLPEMQERARQLQQIVDRGTTVDVLADPEVKNLTEQLAAKDKELNEAESAVICEHEGTCGSGKVGAGPAWQEKVALRDRLRTERDTLSAQLAAAKTNASTQDAATADRRLATTAAELDQLRKQIATATGERDAEKAAFERGTVRADGLIGRMEALGRLTSRSSEADRARWALTLFLIAVDLLPALVKMFMAFGEPTAYERTLGRVEADQEAEAEREFAVRDAQRRADLETAQHIAEATRRAELDLHQSALLKANAVREEAMDRALEKWAADLRAAMDDDPGAFLT